MSLCVLFLFLPISQLVVNGVNRASVVSPPSRQLDNWVPSILKLFDPERNLPNSELIQVNSRRRRTRAVPIGPKIIGGVYEEEPIPYQLSLFYNQNYTCGAVIYSESIALTAAHCVARPRDYFVRAGVHNLSHFEDHEQLIQVQKIQIHPNYDSHTHENDIAILFLKSPLRFNQFVNKVRIADTQSPNFDGERAWVSGWGRTTPDRRAERHSVVLRELEVFILPFQICRVKYQRHIPDTNLCAGSLSSKNVCDGDSGGPLVVRNYGSQKEDILVGLVSWSHATCATEGFPGVYARVSKFAEWIRGESEGKKFANFYEHPNFRGNSYRGELVECQNVSSWIDNWTSSIDPEGNCVIIYDDANCQGSFTQIEPSLRSRGNSFTGDVGMNDRISSFRKCSVDEVHNSAVYVKFYEHPNHQGKFHRGVLSHNGECQNIPTWLNDFTSSVDTENHCVMTFDAPNCQGSFTQFKPGSRGHFYTGDVGMNDRISSYRKCSLDEDNNSAIYVNFYEHPNHQGKFHRGILDLNGKCENIPAWLNDFTSSVHTENNCMMVFEDANCQGSVTQIKPGSWGHSFTGHVGMDDRISSYRKCTQNEDSISDPNYIRLYEHPHEGGKFHRGPLGQGECQNLPPWLKDFTSSVNTENHCVMIFDDTNCQGSFTELRTGSRGLSYTGDVGMNDRISSYRKCTAEEENILNGIYVRFYEHPHERGKFHRGPLGQGECQRIPVWLNDFTSSVNTEGHCVMVFDDPNCRGSSIQLKPGSKGLSYTGDVGMDDRISSYRKCTKEEVEKPNKLVFLGDSITQFWDQEIWNQYYAPLEAANLGVSGDVTQQTINRINNNGILNNLKTRLAVLNIGTNDLVRGPGANGDDNYIAQQIRKILDFIQKKQPGVTIILLGILPRNGKDKHLRIRNINSMIKNYDNGSTVRFLDMENKFSTGLNQLIPGLFNDGLHLTKQGYRIWAETMAPLLNEISGT